MSRPLLTVGLAFHDEERWLEAAVRSVLRQSMGDFELVLVDDGSRDRSLEIANSFVDARIRVVSDGRRERLGTRLNQIIAAARGRFIARMDGDDVVHPSRFERQVGVLLERDDVDAVGSWAALIDGADEPLAVMEVPNGRVTPERALLKGVMPHATLVARREWCLQYPYDESLSRAEDRDLWCRSYPRSRFVALPTVLYLVRVVTGDPCFVSKYVAAQRQNRMLYRRYGLAMIGLRRSARAWMSSWAKSLAVTASSHLGLADALVARRGRAMTPDEHVAIAEALRSAKP